MGERAGRWLRVSGGKQDEANQEPDVDGWITGHGYEPGPSYTIRGGSAFKGNPKFDQAWASVLDDFRHGRITVLVVWKLDRLDRKLEAFGMLGQAVEAGGRVEFVTQPHLNDLTTMGGRIALKVQEEIAHEESRIKSDRIRITHARIRGNGGYLGRPAFGFRRTGDRYSPVLVPVEGDRELARQAFEQVAAGASLNAVGGWLAQQTGRPWWPSAVAGMIRNPCYRGMVTDAQGRALHRCEAIVTGQLWQAANESLDARPKRGARLAEGSVLSGALSCIKCAGPMYRIRTGGGWYYRCVGKGARRGSACRNMVRCDRADALVDDVMSRIAGNVIEWRLVKGSNHDAELADVGLGLRDLASQGLDEDAEDAERGRLRAERKRLMSLPAVPDQWVPVETGETYAAQWAALAPAARRAWLKANAPRLHMGKDGMQAALFADEDEDSEPMAAGLVPTYHTGRGLVLVITWKAQQQA
jgi:DNA invertase Pin-like site-specific DNA recombinase